MSDEVHHIGCFKQVICFLISQFIFFCDVSAAITVGGCYFAIFLNEIPPWKYGYVMLEYKKYILYIPSESHAP